MVFWLKLQMIMVYVFWFYFSPVQFYESIPSMLAHLMR